mgnify:CR=1 FL=1
MIEINFQVDLIGDAVGGGGSGGSGDAGFLKANTLCNKTQDSEYHYFTVDRHGQPSNVACVCGQYRYTNRNNSSYFTTRYKND